MPMDKKETITLVAAIIASLHETDNSGCPESTLYILCGMDMDKWNYIRGIMLRADWLSIKGNYVTLTPAGIKMGVEINKSISKPN